MIRYALLGAGGLFVPGRHRLAVRLQRAQDVGDVLQAQQHRLTVRRQRLLVRSLGRTLTRLQFVAAEAAAAAG